MIFDLTHPINAVMPVYPGKKQPVITASAAIENDGYRELNLQLDGHTGTHIDSPAHMLPDGKFLDQYPVEKFYGKAIIIPVKNDPMIEIANLSVYEEDIREADFVLLRTGWDKYWGSAQYFGAFPVLSEAAAGWLTAFRLKGIGVDVISVDPLDSTTFPVHHVLFQHDLTIIENLTFPQDMTASRGTFQCFPLPVKGADGTPVRAVFYDNL